MKTSVVIRALNEEENIAKCLDALLFQSKVPDEIIVVDNGSTDNTIEIVKSYASKKVKLLNCAVRGYTPGLNLGAEKAKYDLLIYLSADCIPEKAWLETLVTLQEKTGAAVVQGNEVIAISNAVHKQLAKEENKEQDARIKFFNNTNTLYDLNILKNYLPFFEPGRLGGEDTIMSLRYAKDGRLAYFSSQAKVAHNKFNNLKEFENHMYDHGKLSRWFLINYFAHPRLYLNSYYWAAREIITGIGRRDTNSVHIGASRFYYNLLGFLNLPTRKANS